MNDKGEFIKGFIGGLVAMLVIGGLMFILFSDNAKIEVNNESIKERNETYISTCENWKICDYREQIFGCNSMHCSKTYQCWREIRNCLDKNIEEELLINMTHLDLTKFKNFVNDTKNNKYEKEVKNENRN